MSKYPEKFRQPFCGFPRLCMLYMASGSGSHGQDGEDGSWLDLGLGLSQFSNLQPASLSMGHHQSTIGLGCGDDDGVSRPAGAVQCSEGWQYYQSAAGNWPSSTSSLIFPPSSLLASSCRGIPEVGLWFILLAMPSWRRDCGALPQIPKAYIRVKDETMTILMVKKYLARKLGLAGEFEIEISCMGMKLLNSQTLRHVRDTVWIQGLEQSLGAVQSFHSSLHLMALRYCRS